MKKKLSSSFILLMLISFSMHAQNKLAYPKTQAIPVVDTLHHQLITDEYRWLEDKNDPKVLEWTKAQHEFTLNYLSKNQKTYPELRKSLENFIDLDYEGPLTKEGKRIFQYIKRKGDKQNQLYTQIGNKKILIFDPVKIDTTGNSSISSVDYTYNGERAAISVQKSGGEISTLYIIDTRTGKMLCKPLENVFGFAWTKSQESGYVTIRTKKDIDEQLPLKTYLWKLGDPMSKASLVGTTKDAKNTFYIYDNEYGNVSFYGESDFYSNSLYIKTTGSKEEGKLIYESKKYSVYPNAMGERFYMRTNDNAPNYKLMVGDVKQPDAKNWKVLIPESDVVIEDYVVTNTNIIVKEKKDVQNTLSLYDLDGKFIKKIELPENGDVVSCKYYPTEDSVYLTLSTFTSTAKSFMASAKDFKWRLYYQQIIPVDMSNIVGEIKFYTSKDGTKVPFFLIHRKDIKLDGNNPCLVTGYGGFQIGISVHNYGVYSHFLNSGGVIAEPGIRGGDEYGEKWHEGAMLDKKQNCFDDFIACSEWLVENKYTNPQRMAAMGGSNGGLLMGAIATQRPDLYKAIVCKVPLLDMIRYHKFLIARYWIPEYGSSDNEKDFRWLLRYSPYHNIRKGINLPAMMVTTGANESRVDPMNAKKFVAALQNNESQINPILLFVDYNSGHGSGQSAKQRIENMTYSLEFIMNQLGM